MYLHITKQPSSIDQLIEIFGESITKTFVKIAMSTLLSKDIVRIENGLYYSNMTKEQALAEISKTFQDEEKKASAKTSRYYNEYGFDALLMSVARWIDHEDKTVRVYDIDRLYLCRYVDYLDKAKQYLAWRSSDNSIAQEKLRKIKSQASKASKSK